MSAYAGDEVPRLRTVEEVARHFTVSPGFVYKRVAAGAWPHHRFGVHIKFTDDDVAQIAELTARPALVNEQVAVPHVVAIPERVARARAIKESRAAERRTTQQRRRTG